MKYECPCCGCYTLPVTRSAAHGYICPVCFWENDVFISRDDELSACNHGMTLIEGRSNYNRFGACEEGMLAHVRKPTKEELTGNVNR